MTEKEIEHLGWIHSNKFTIPRLFQKKFFPQNTYRAACYVLNKYAKKGLLLFEKPNMFAHNFYFLTIEAIRTLDEMDEIPIMGRKHPIRINPYEREHDLMVQELRIVIEASPELEDIFWVSDFEMRSGITPETKAEFQQGKLERDWRKWAWRRSKSLVRRTPDGYFEADLEGEREGYVLEFERSPYNQKMVQNMVWYLSDSFPYARRMIVSETEKHAVRMFRNLEFRVKEDKRPQWYISCFGKVTTMDFTKSWRRLSHPLGQPVESKAD
jgi:hypothetical protein